LLTTGTTTRSKQEIQDQLDQLKSSLNIRFSGQHILISVSSYRNTIKETMDILNDVLKNPVFPESELTKLKLEHVTYLESTLNDPQQLAFTKLAQATSNEEKGSIFHASSTQEDIDGAKAVTTQDLKEFYAKFFGSNNGVATVLGMQNQEEAKGLLEHVLGNWNNQATFERAYPTFFETKKGKEITLTPDKENAAAVGQLNFQMNKSNPDYAALTLANEVMGGGFMTARIPQRLREKEGISYGAGTNLTVPNSPKSNTASWMIFAFLNPTKQGEVETAINEEFTKLVADGITEEELKANKISWKSSRQAALGNDNYLLSLSTLYFAPLDK